MAEILSVVLAAAAVVVVVGWLASRKNPTW